MWEEGACIYGIPGVPNNFPPQFWFNRLLVIEKKKEKKKGNMSIKVSYSS